MNGKKHSIETALDVSSRFPGSELEGLSPMLTYINWLTAKIGEDGELMTEDSDLPREAEKRGTVPLLTVSCTVPEAAHRLFTEKEAGESFLSKLLVYAQANGYKGVNFSFFRMFPFERDKYTLFLRKCADALHARGLSAGSIVPPPCALSLAAANDYKAQGEILDRVNFLLSDCLYRKDSLKRRLPDDLLSETLGFAGENIPSRKLAVTLADHGLVPAGGETQVLPCALARSLSVPGAEYDTEKSYSELFEKITSHGVTGISVRPAGRTDKLIFEVLSEKYEIIRT